jgi:hypothetical protein
MGALPKRATSNRAGYSGARVALTAMALAADWSSLLTPVVRRRVLGIYVRKALHLRCCVRWDRTRRANRNPMSTS